MSPLTDIFSQLNWIDLGYIVLFLRIAYIAFRNGFVVEIAKLCGALLAVYLSLHYYTAISDFVRPHIKTDIIPLKFLDFFFFLLVAFLGYAVSILLRESLSRLIKLEAIPLLHKWGGLAVAAARAILLASLISYAMWVSTVSYVSRKVQDAHFGSMFIKAAPAVYKTIWDGFMSKFMRHEQYNGTVDEVLKELEQ